MHRSPSLSIALLCSFSFTGFPAASGQKETVEITSGTVLTGARIHTAAGAPIENGYLVIDKGKIVAIGSSQNTELKVGGEGKLRDMAGMTIIPGLVDTHSHIGIYSRPAVPANSDGNEGSGPVQPGLRAIDAIFPNDPGIRMATAGGVTTANIMPGSGNAIGGQPLYA